MFPVRGDGMAYIGEIIDELSRDEGHRKLLRVVDGSEARKLLKRGEIRKMHNFSAIRNSPRLQLCLLEQHHY